MLNTFTILLILGAVVSIIGHLTIDKVITGQTFLGKKVGRFTRRRNGTWLNASYALYLGTITLYTYMFEPDLLKIKGFWLIAYLIMYAVAAFILTRSAIRAQKNLNREKQEALEEMQDM